jgi:hypothetical protein
MTPINISIVALGHQKEPINFDYMRKWQSNIFSIQAVQSISFSPDAIGEAGEYPDSQISELIKSDPNVRMTIVVVSAPLERNFYSRRLRSNVAVLSLHEMAHIVKDANFRVEDFLLRSIYGYCVYYKAFLGELPASVERSWSHHDIRGCLFDMNRQKYDILYSMHQPNLCEKCVVRLKEQQIESGFAESVQGELMRIRRPLFFRCADWVKRHPIYSLLFTSAFGVFLNVVASVLFEKAKKIMPWLS